MPGAGAHKRRRAVVVVDSDADADNDEEHDILSDEEDIVSPQGRGNRAADNDNEDLDSMDPTTLKNALQAETVSLVKPHAKPIKKARVHPREDYASTGDDEVPSSSPVRLPKKTKACSMANVHDSF